MVTIAIDDVTQDVYVEKENRETIPENMWAKNHQLNPRDKKSFIVAVIAAYDIVNMMKMDIDDLMKIKSEKERERGE